jgi:hypothetical protein
LKRRTQNWDGRLTIGDHFRIMVSWQQEQILWLWAWGGSRGDHYLLSGIARTHTARMVQGHCYYYAQIKYTTTRHIDLDRYNVTTINIDNKYNNKR